MSIVEETWSVLSLHVQCAKEGSKIVRGAKIRWHNGYAHEYRITNSLSERYLELRDKFAYLGVPRTAEGEFWIWEKEIVDWIFLSNTGEAVSAWRSQQHSLGQEQG